MLKPLYIDNAYFRKTDIFQHIEMPVVSHKVVCAGIEGAVHKLVVIGVSGD